MSLRDYPGGKLFNIIEALFEIAILALCIGVWAAAGFPRLMEVAAIGCAIAFCVAIWIGIHKWMASRP
jgi:hypothetical protein